MKKIIYLFVLVCVLPCVIIFAACKKSAKPQKQQLIEINTEGVELSIVEFAYDGTEKEVSVLDGSLPNYVEVESLSGDVKATNVGTYTVRVNLKYVGEDANKYAAIPTLEFVWEIIKSDFNISSENVALVQNQFQYSSSSNRTVSVNTELLPENVQVKGISGTSTAKIVGNYTVTVELEYVGEDKDNYNPIPTFELNWSIIPYEISINATALQLKTNTLQYNGEDQQVEFNENGFSVIPNNVSINITGTTQKNAGNYTAIITLEYIGETPENYRLNTTTIKRSWSITKADLTVTANDVEIAAGTEEPEGAGFVCTGFIGDDNESVIDGDAEYDFGEYSVEAQVGDTFVVSVSGLRAQNYTITYQTGTATVVEAEQPQEQEQE